ncbi:hypothetical protein DMA11_17175 [Marinilabiliaceae bacterium JC017]|nr:hypothetical protein DMA11_17175 [Marinilabiliaceae bacterium JC017]
MRIKSTEEQLEKRGFLPEEFDTKSYDLTTEEALELLQSKAPKERTLAARLLPKEGELERAVDGLLNALILEKKLYSKMEISNALARCGEIAIRPLIGQFGRIGENQHQTVPDKAFKKLNYPLPRDIAARTIIRIGSSALPDLLKFIETAKEEQLSEAIDAIGFICFYNGSKGVFHKLKNRYESIKDNDLVKWKIIRACSGLPESLGFLQQEKEELASPRLQREIDRSIGLIRQRVT